MRIGASWSGRRKALVASGVVLLLGAAYVAFTLWRDPWVLMRAELKRQRSQFGLDHGQLQAAGHRWVYAYSDQAPARAPIVVLLHGFTGSKENWYPVAQRLRTRYRLLIPDLPGWGASERKPGEDYGFAAQAERISAFISATTSDAPVVLIGHAMGGGIAALDAAGHPHQIARLGLIDAAGVRFADDRFGAEVLTGRNPFAVSDAASLRRHIDRVFHRPEARPWIPWPISSLMAQRRRRDAGFEQKVLDRIVRSDERFAPGNAAGGILQPTLLLWCRQDAVIDPSALQVYAARIPQAHKVLLDDCGHMSIMERPTAVADAVVQLIEEGDRK